MSTRSRITLRILAAALLIIAGVKLMLAFASSFQTEERIPQSDGGYQIHHVVEINHWTVVLALFGGVMFILSFFGRRTQA